MSVSVGMSETAIFSSLRSQFSDEKYRNLILVKIIESAESADD